MKFQITYMVEKARKQMFIEAKDLDEAEEKINAKKLKWEEIRIVK